jgi:hypothetical protein
VNPYPVAADTRRTDEMNREELLQREADAWIALEAAFTRVPADRRVEEGVVPGWSVQDLVWHCAKWAEYTGGNLEAMAAGTYVDEDHDDAYWDAMNADIAAQSKSLTWDEVVDGAAEMRARARAAMGALSDLTDAAAEDFSGETFEHYEEHTTEIAAFADGL